MFGRELRFRKIIVGKCFKNLAPPTKAFPGVLLAPFVGRLGVLSHCACVIHQTHANMSSLGAKMVKAKHLGRIAARARRHRAEIRKNENLINDRITLFENLTTLNAADVHPSAARRKRGGLGRRKEGAAVQSFAFFELTNDCVNESAEAAAFAAVDAENAVVLEHAVECAEGGQTFASLFSSQPVQVRRSAASRQALLRHFRDRMCMEACGSMRARAGCDPLPDARESTVPESERTRLREAGLSVVLFEEHLSWLPSPRTLASVEHVEDYLGLVLGDRPPERFFLG